MKTSLLVVPFTCSTHILLHAQVEQLIIDFRVVVVEGAPGIGKSCLAWKLGVQWSKGELLTSFPLLIFLRFRDNSVQSARDLGDLFPHSHPDQKTQTAVQSWIECNLGKGCLLVLDGYDELPPGAQTSSIFSEIVRGHLLPQAHLVVTSRPSAVVNLLDLCKTQEPKHVEITGFTEAQVWKYVHRAFHQDEGQLQAFKKYLECHPIVLGLMYVPLNAAIVVHVYQGCNRERRGPTPRTMTELYTMLVLSLVYRDHQHRHLGNSSNRHPGNVGMEPVDSLSDLPSCCHSSIVWMAGLAYHGCLEDRLVFHNIPKSKEALG